MKIFSQGDLRLLQMLELDKDNKLVIEVDGRRRVRLSQVREWLLNNSTWVVDLEDFLEKAVDEGLMIRLEGGRSGPCYQLTDDLSRFCKQGECIAA